MSKEFPILSMGSARTVSDIVKRWERVHLSLIMFMPDSTVSSMTPYTYKLYGEKSDLLVAWEHDRSGRVVVRPHDNVHDVTEFFALLDEEQIIEICLQWLATEV